MIDELRGQHLGQQTRARDASRQRPVGALGAGHALATHRASVLGQHMDPDLEACRDELEFASLVLADPRLGSAAAGAGLVGFGQVMLDADMGQTIEVRLPRPSRLPRRGGRGLRLRRGGFGDVRAELEEMPLCGIVVPLAPPSEDVAAIAIQLLAQTLVLLLQGLVGVGRPIEGGEQVIEAFLGGRGRVAGRRRRVRERARRGTEIEGSCHHPNYRMLTSDFKGFSRGPSWFFPGFW